MRVTCAMSTVSTPRALNNNNKATTVKRRSGVAMRYVRDAMRRDATHGMEWLAVGNLGRRDLCAFDGWMDGWTTTTSDG